MNRRLQFSFLCLSLCVLVLIVYCLQSKVLQKRTLGTCDCVAKDKAVKKVHTAEDHEVPASDTRDTFLLPNDDVINTMNVSEITNTFWRYVHTLQYLCRNQTRLGPMGDGGKEVCIDNLYKPRNPCLVYSFGSNFNYGFELGVAEMFHCEIHTFDPSMSISNKQAPRFLTFHRIGLGSSDHRDEVRDWGVATLSTIVRKLQHTKRSIDILKIDIEGDEWNALPQILESGEMQRVRQLCIEIHFGRRNARRKSTQTWGNVSLSTQLEVLRELHKHGYYLFMREYNRLGVYKVGKPYKEITNCLELGFVNVNLQYSKKDFDYERFFGNKKSEFM